MNKLKIDSKNHLGFTKAPLVTFWLLAVSYTINL